MLLKVAWKNIWRNRRRSLITIASILFATFIIILMRGIQIGTFNRNIENSLEMFTSYIQIQVDDYQDHPNLLNTFAISDKLKSILTANKKIIAYSPRIMANGLIGDEKQSFFTEIIAINPEIEKSVSTINSKVTQGNFLSSKNIYDIVVGYTLLKNLKSKIGDTLVILSSGYDGSMGNLKFRVAGIMKTGSPEFDGMTVLMHIDAARELLSINNKVSSIAVNVGGLDNIDIVKQYLSKNLKNIKLKYNKNLIALDWKELMSDFKQLMDMKISGGYIYLGLLLIVVAFGLFNTITMSITERFKEFGIMLAWGIKQQSLVLLVFFETVFISFIGIIIGVISGFCFNYYLVLNPFKITGDLAKMYKEYGFEPAIYSSISADIFSSTIYILVIMVFIVFIFSAIKLMKLEALKGIRYT